MLDNQMVSIKVASKLTPDESAEATKVLHQTTDVNKIEEMSEI
jgi:hypothetical protein